LISLSEEIVITQHIDLFIHFDPILPSRTRGLLFRHLLGRILQVHRYSALDLILEHPVGRTLLGGRHEISSVVEAVVLVHVGVVELVGVYEGGLVGAGPEHAVGLAGIPQTRVLQGHILVLLPWQGVLHGLLQAAELFVVQNGTFPT